MERINKQYYHDMFLSALLVVKQKEDAEDLCQEILITLWEKKHLLQIANLKQYLCRCAYYGALKAYEHKKKTPQLDNMINEEFLLRLQDPEYDPEEEELEKEVRTLLLLQRVQEALCNQYGKKALEIFSRVKIDGEKQKDVAISLGLSVLTVETQIKKMMSHLRKELNNKN
ncbi:hypothetical protein [Chitinophaga sp. YR627]|uniref:hypothetical protein n=1 Tax=Chitinophaga sp. YR627 TaxID=1881041 RepID=UPI0011607812|nr:hypothetical protein [Chitinophaga sp. YR627]